MSLPPRSGSGESAKLSLEEFRQLRALLNTHYGLELADDQRIFLERKLRERVHAQGLGTFGDYIRFLHSVPLGKQELDEAIEQVVTNETYFCREPNQLKAFREEVLPLLIAQSPRKRLTIWSAGCSTGEEPYTLATLLLETPELADWELLIIGTDVSRRCLQSARRGVFAISSFRATSNEFRRKWFVERDGYYHIIERVKERCHFAWLNLLDGQRIATVGRVDAIFCRNVLIYLDQAAREQVIELFHDRLYPGGVLCLGHSESLLHQETNFELLHLKDDLVYRKAPTMLQNDRISSSNLRIAMNTSPNVATTPNPSTRSFNSDSPPALGVHWPLPFANTRSPKGGNRD